MVKLSRGKPRATTERGRASEAGRRKEEAGMTLEEKRDMLLEVLADLYTIKAADKGENTVLDYKIRVTEKRLEVLGVNDFSTIRP